jgi:hypothetical protein
MTDTRPMLDGRELSEFELAQIRRQIKNLETIDAVRVRHLSESRSW